MGEVLDRLRNLLEEERSAAIRADIPTLERLQVEKMRVVEDLDRNEDAKDPVYERLVERAQKNVRLLQKLTDLHRAMLGGSIEPAYTARGSFAKGEGGGALLRRST